MRGHEIIRRSKAFIEDQGFEVIYGDTDSLFVLLGGAPGCAGGRFRSRGAAERLVAGEPRRGAPPRVLSRDRAREPVRAVPHADGARNGQGDQETLRGARARPRRGRARARLQGARDGCARTGRRSPGGSSASSTERCSSTNPARNTCARPAMRSSPGSSTKSSSTGSGSAGRSTPTPATPPPHVQAARRQSRPGSWVSYVVTANGPLPLEALDAEPDYAHYRDRQLAPAADGILRFLGTSFETLTTAQLF